MVFTFNKLKLRYLTITICRLNTDFAIGICLTEKWLYFANHLK